MQLDPLLTVSPIAASQAPSKMGFKAGTTVTLENALAMMMVKSANDMAAVIAEGVSGSIEKFADEMNKNALRHRHDADELRQSERPAGRRTDHLGARHGDAGARDHPRHAGVRVFHAHSGDQVRPPRHPQLQQPDRPLSRRRRHEDRLHLRLRLQSRRLRHAQQQADDRGRARRAVLAGARRQGRAAARARLRPHLGAVAGCTPSLGTLASMEPIAAEPPNLRDDMCGPKRKRPRHPNPTTTTWRSPRATAEPARPATTASRCSRPRPHRAR